MIPSSVVMRPPAIRSRHVGDMDDPLEQSLSEKTGVIEALSPVGTLKIKHVTEK